MTAGPFGRRRVTLDTWPASWRPLVALSSSPTHWSLRFGALGRRFGVYWRRGSAS